jgi:hypothetical protein
MYIASSSSRAVRRRLGALGAARRLLVGQSSPHDDDPYTFSGKVSKRGHLVSSSLSYFTREEGVGGPGSRSFLRQCSCGVSVIWNPSPPA